MNSLPRSAIYADDALKRLKKLKSESFAAGVTSPPYNKQEKQKGWLVANVLYDRASDALPENKYQDLQVRVLDELHRVTIDGGSFFYNHKIRWNRGRLIHPMEWLSRTKWTIRQEIVWDRKIAANIRGWRFWQTEERIYWLYKKSGVNPKRVYDGHELNPAHAKLTSIWRFSPEQKNSHPAPFPIELPTRALAAVLHNQPKSAVIDPYAGSGTTLLAAKLLKHNYVGIDSSREYVKAARNRLKAPSDRDITRFKQEVASHAISKTFADRKRHGESVGKLAPKTTNQKN